MRATTISAAPAERILTRPFVTACVTIFFAAFSFQILMPVIPLYLLHIGGKDSQVGLVMGVSAVASLLLRPLVGFSADRFGRKPLVILGPATYGICAVLYHFARSLPPLLLVRLINGVGLSANSTGLSTYVADIAPQARRAEAMGLFGASLNIASALGPLAGFWLSEAYSFDAVFLLSGVAAALAVLLGLQISERRVSDSSQPRFSGMTLVSKDAAFPSALVLFLTVTYGAVTSYLAVLVKHDGLGNPGIFFLVFSATIVVTRLFAGRIADRLGRTAVLIPGMLGLSAGMALIALAHSMLFILGAGVVYGFGFGTVHPAMQAMVIDRAQPGRLGTAMGTFSGAFDLGIGGGAAAWGLVVLAFGVRGVFALGAFAPLGAVLLVLASSAPRFRRAPAAADTA
ncbi:MAG TPA: MFS transporter [Dehalococcoidia bacterium]|nr:MFS transporter [Dehalococcoidia bacterium]